MLGQVGSIRVNEQPRTGTSAPFVATAWLRRLDGKKVRLEVCGSSVSNARQNLIERAQVKKHEGTSNATNLTAHSTYEEVVLEYLNFERRDDRIKPQSVDRYESMAKNHLLPSLGEFLLHELTRAVVSSFARKLPPSTARECRKVFRNSWRWAQDENLVDRDCPWGDIILKSSTPLPKKRDDYATPEQLLELRRIADADSPFMAALMRTSMDTGMRISELLGLSRADIDWENATLTVRSGVVHQKGRGLVRGDTKTHSSVRVLKITEATLAKISELAEHLDAMCHFEADPTQIPLLSIDGKFNYPSSVNKRRREMLAGTGLEGITPHTIRKTIATVVANATKDHEAAAEILGHENIMVTGRHYYQRDTGPRDATGAMEKFLESGGQKQISPS